MPFFIDPQLTGRGRLQVDALALTITTPLENATVRVMKGGGETAILEEMLTDSSGQSPIIELPAPPVEFSQYPSEQMPYSEYDITVTAPGFEKIVVEGVQILPDTLSYQDCFLSPVTAAGGQVEIIHIDEHTLWGNFPPKIPEEEVKELPPSTGLVVLPEVVIPEFIIVHLGRPDDRSARNIWISFPDYIKNVASSEIYATWPEQTIRANVLAIISLTLNRVFTEWYRNQGYDFHITNSTAFDQAFVPGRNIFEEISRIVDDIFKDYIARPNARQPLFAQYCDGQRVSCPNWMRQWESRDLGEKGFFTLDILRHFYGFNIYLRQAQQVEGVPRSFPGTPLQVGSIGPDVRRIQEQLNMVSTHYPAIPRIRVDGVFDEETRASVQKFQSIFRLSSDGIVGSATWHRLAHIYVAVTRMAEL